MHDGPEPNETVQVLEAGTGWGPAAVAGRLLADSGCSVLMLEPPAGNPLRRQEPVVDGTSLAFQLLAGGKGSVCLDPGDPATAGTLAALMQQADVVLWESGWAGVTPPPAPPAAVWCQLSPTGSGGPFDGQDLPELLLQSLGGILAVTGGEWPLRVGVPLTAHLGGLYAAIAALAGLEQRRATGKGLTVDLSLQDCLLSTMGTQLPGYLLENRRPERLQNRHPLSVPWNTYPTADGWAVICCGTDRQWTALLPEMGRPDLVNDPRFSTMGQRVVHVDLVDRLVGAWTRHLPTAEVASRLDALRIPATAVVDLPALLADPYFASRGLLDRSGPRGLSPLLQQTAPPGAAPTLGADTDRILRAKGYDTRPPNTLWARPSPKAGESP